ncbi:MAG: hypothetical protein PF590_11060 [Candidatus Delongbacteria bacterium]|jgi:hypothetical protein|nr:hypothetical protein [Candidatus Delongbacteria bacterium]
MMNIKNKIWILCIGMVAMSSTLAQENDNITSFYNKMFTIEKNIHNERAYLFVSVNDLSGNSKLASLINNNKKYLDYLLTHFSGYTQQKDLYEIDNENKLHEAFIAYLKNNDEFNTIMQRFAATQLNTNNFIPDTITMDEMLDVAVKFFYIRGITKEGYYETQICIGINGIEVTTENRNSDLEAFCFSVIFSNFQSEENVVYDELVSGVKDVYKLNLGTDENEKLLRAQGAMYMYMRHNEKLKDLLIGEYMKREQNLTFVLKTE